MVKKYVIFMIGGGLGALVNLGIIYVFTDFLGFWYIFSCFLGAVANIIFNFAYHRRITFGVKDNMQNRFLRFAAINIAVGITSISFIYMLTEWLNIWYVISAAISAVSIGIVNFFINKNWVFRYREAD